MEPARSRTLRIASPGRRCAPALFARSGIQIAGRSRRRAREGHRPSRQSSPPTSSVTDRGQAKILDSPRQVGRRPQCPPRAPPPWRPRPDHLVTAPAPPWARSPTCPPNRRSARNSMRAPTCSSFGVVLYEMAPVSAPSPAPTTAAVFERHPAQSSSLARPPQSGSCPPSSSASSNKPREGPRFPLPGRLRNART